MDAAREVFGNIGKYVLGDSSSGKTTQNKKMGAYQGVKPKAGVPTPPKKKPTWADFPLLFGKNMLKMGVGVLAFCAVLAGGVALGAALGLVTAVAALVATPFFVGYCIYKIGEATSDWVLKQWERLPSKQ
ncbi:MAG: hypothetical protein JSR46_10010 [Verrucomicrobia bacterium]|nr:hypothetical protein [Verrucomicrobiota bacterium]